MVCSYRSVGLFLVVVLMLVVGTAPLMASSYDDYVLDLDAAGEPVVFRAFEQASKRASMLPLPDGWLGPSMLMPVIGYSEGVVVYFVPLEFDSSNPEELMREVEMRMVGDSWVRVDQSRFNRTQRVRLHPDPDTVDRLLDFSFTTHGWFVAYELVFEPESGSDLLKATVIPVPETRQINGVPIADEVCSPDELEVPVFPGVRTATLKRTELEDGLLSKLVTYWVPAAPESIFRFYQRELGSKGWIGVFPEDLLGLGNDIITRIWMGPDDPATGLLLFIWRMVPDVTVVNLLYEVGERTGNDRSKGGPR